MYESLTVQELIVKLMQYPSNYRVEAMILNRRKIYLPMTYGVVAVDELQIEGADTVLIDLELRP